MATVAEFTVPAESFPLGSIFHDHPGVTVELERVIPTSRAIIPYFWVSGVSKEEDADIEAAFRNHPDVESARSVDEVDGRFLKRVEWRAEYQGLMKAIVETDVVMTSGIGTAEAWRFEVRADERGAIADFQEYCRARDIPVELRSLHGLSETATDAEYDLTDRQREALLLAYERGYFRSPREATLAELATDLGITGQAFGSRLRRGVHRLIGSALVASS